MTNRQALHELFLGLRRSRLVGESVRPFLGRSTQTVDGREVMSDIARLQEMIGRSAFHQLFRPQVLVADTGTLTLSLKAHMSATLERQPGTGQ